MPESHDDGTPTVPVPTDIDSAATRQQDMARSTISGSDNAPDDAQARNNGIIDLDVPPAEDPGIWQARVAEREFAIAECAQDLERSRAGDEEEARRRQAEADAIAGQRELENIATAADPCATTTHLDANW